MAEVTLKGTPAHTSGELPAVGSKAPDFKLVKSDLSEVQLSDYAGKKVILNIFPSVDTGTCAMSVRQFNEKASSMDNAVVLCISMDLPFAMARFCGAEGLTNVVNLSAFRDKGQFQYDYGVGMIDGPLAGLNARSVVVIDEEGKVIYNQLVSEIVDEPDYDSALAVI